MDLFKMHDSVYLNSMLFCDVSGILVRWMWTCLRCMIQFI